MKLNEVFFWFCKEEKILDIMYIWYHNNMSNMGRWTREHGNLVFTILSFKDYIDLIVQRVGIYQLFDKILLYNNVYDNISVVNFFEISKKWKYFVKNNLHFSENFLKKGDTIRVVSGNYNGFQEYVIIDFPKKFDGEIYLNRRNNKIKLNILCYQKIFVNGEEKKPEFYIKKRRKIYGSTK